MAQGKIIEHVVDAREGLSRTAQAHVLRGVFAFSQRVRRWRQALRGKKRHGSQSGLRVVIILTPGPSDDYALVLRSIHSLLRQTWTPWELRVPQAMGVACKVDDRVRACDDCVAEAPTPGAAREFVGFLRAGDELATEALHQLAHALEKQPRSDVVYTDETTVDASGAIASHFFKPDWSPRLLLSMNYLGGFVAVRRDLAVAAGGAGQKLPADCTYDFVLRATERARGVAHLDEALYIRHSPPAGASQTEDMKALRDALERRGLRGTVAPMRKNTDAGRYIVHYAITHRPLISIVIPTRNQGDVLRRCVESIESRTSYPNYEIIVIDHSSDDPGTREYLASLRHRIHPYRGRFNYSKMNNDAAQLAKGEVIVFLNNDTRVISADWLDLMLEQALQPGVGIVGAKLLYPDRSVQHAGTIVGYQRSAVNYGGMPYDAPGYNGLADATRECSAVTGACMMIRRSVFEELGGFDVHMDRAWQDVDLCLRANRHGRAVVYAPCALLYHDEGHTRGRFDDSAEEHASKRLLQRKHREVLRNGDPYYNRNLSSYSDIFSHEPAEMKGLTLDSPFVVARMLSGYHHPHAQDTRWISRRCRILLLTSSERSHTFGFSLQAGDAHCYQHLPIRVGLWVNGAKATEIPIHPDDGRHEVRLLLPAGLAAHVLEIRSSESFIPAELGINADHRRLALVLADVAVDEDLLQETPVFRLRHIRGFHHHDPNRWAGPHVELELDTALPGPHTLVARARCHRPEVYGTFPFRVFASIDNVEVASTTFTAAHDTSVLKIPTSDKAGITRIRLMAESFFVPADHALGIDSRELSYVIEQIEFRPGPISSNAPSVAPGLPV